MSCQVNSQVQIPVIASAWNAEGRSSETKPKKSLKPRRKRGKEKEEEEEEDGKRRKKGRRGGGVKEKHEIPVSIHPFCLSLLTLDE